MTASPYADAFLDWLACAVAGLREFARADMRHAPWDDLASGVYDDILILGAAGHLLDYDDTYTPGLSHLSAATAPVALVLAHRTGQDVARMLEAYRAGFEAMARMSERSHPRLYDNGWHATAVCGTVGAAVTAAHLLGLNSARTRESMRLALLSASGLRTAFGSHGKPIQVGMSAANGMIAARLARSGATVSQDVETGPGSFEDVYGGDCREVLASRGQAAIERNWIKAYPCCLQTHAPIDAGLKLRSRHVGRISEPTVTVHPVSRQAAAYDDVSTGLQAKFSIPYTTAWAILRGPPTLQSFDDVDEDVRSLARRIQIMTNPDLEVNGAILEWHSAGGEHLVEIKHPLGSPGNPLGEKERAAKVLALAGPDLIDILDDRHAPAAKVARAVAL